MQKLSVFVLIASIIFPTITFAGTVITNQATYEIREAVTFTLSASQTGVLLFRDDGTPFKCLKDAPGAGAYDLSANCTAFGVYPSSTAGTYVLLAQNGNTCWNGNNDNLATCLARGQTDSSSTFQVIDSENNLVMAQETLIWWTIYLIQAIFTFGFIILLVWLLKR